MKRVSRKAHPNLFEVVELLKKEQAASEVAIKQLAGGGTIRSKQRKVVQHEDTIKKLKAEFTNGVRSLDAFVNSLSHCVVLLVGNSLEKIIIIILIRHSGTWVQFFFIHIMGLDILGLDILGIILIARPIIY